jgi:hypothetical protein
MQNQGRLWQNHKQDHNPESKIKKYKFSIYHKAILEYETDSSDTSSDIGSEDTEQTQELYIPPKTKFYEKQNFIAYLTPAKREIIDDLDLFSLATSAIHGEYISDKEYVEYNEDDDQFVCITECAVIYSENGEDTLEHDAIEYFKENSMPYRWSYRGSPAFAKWDEKKLN